MLNTLILIISAFGIIISLIVSVNTIFISSARTNKAKIFKSRKTLKKEFKQYSQEEFEFYASLEKSYQSKIPKNKNELKRYTLEYYYYQINKSNGLS